MSGRRVAVAIDGYATDVVNIVIAKDGIAHQITRGLISCGGVARQFWPPTDVDPDQIFLPTTPITTNDIVQFPDNAFATLTFEIASGLMLWKYNGQHYSEFALRPPTTNTGQFLIRLNPVSGSVQGHATGAWFDIHYLGPAFNFEWYVAQNGIGVNQAVADLSIAKDAGGGIPETATIKTRRVTFLAEVTSATLVWNSNRWDLEEIKVNETADCELRFEPSGWAYGYADTSGNFNEQWSSVPKPLYTVQVNHVSGDTPSGLLGVPLLLDQVHSWVLTAASENNLFCELDVVVTDDFANANIKRVTMHSQYRKQASDDLLWTTESLSYNESAPGEPIGYSLIHIPNGIAYLDSIAYGPPVGWPVNWHSAAPDVLNGNQYEVRCDIIAGSAPIGAGSAQFSVWHNGAAERAWIFLAQQGPTSFDVTVQWSYRRLGQPSTTATKTIRLRATGGV